MEFAQAEIRRLEELRLYAVMERIDADLDLGDDAGLIPELHALVEANPLQERLRGQLMLALYRAGRQADALEVYRRARRQLGDELGLEPGPDLKALQIAILNQAPWLVPRHRREADQPPPELGAQPTELLEREDELAVADRFLRRAGAGAGSVITVEGPAGIGKTALLGVIEARARAAGFEVARARGSEFEAGMAFGLTRQLLEPVIVAAVGAERRRLLAGAARVGAQVLGAEAGEPVTDRFAAIHGLYWLCANLAAPRPVAICVDDAQWADDASLTWLGYLARRAGDLAVLVVVAVRLGDRGGERGELAGMLDDVAAARLALRELSAPAVGAIVQSRLDAGADEPFRSACVELSGGNPLFLRELLAAASAERLPAHESGVSRLRAVAPEAIAASVLTRLARQGADAVALARAVAVLGARTEVGVAAALAGLDPTVAELGADRLGVAQIFAAARPLEFTHPVIEAAVRDDIAPGALRVAHRRAAELLHRRGQAPLAEIAAHLLLCGPGEDGWVVDVLRRAARQAGARGSPETAVSYLERGLQEAVPAPVRTELLFELGTAMLQAGRGGAMQRMRDALELSTGRRRRAEISLALGRALLAQGDADARVAFRRGLAELSPDDDDELALELQGWNLTTSSVNNEEALPPAVRDRLDALLAGETPAGTRPERFLLAHAAFRGALSGERPHDQVARLASRALADGALLTDSGGDVGTHGAACYALVFAGDLDAAIGECDRAIAWSRQRGARVALGFVSRVRGIARYERGAISDALADFATASELHEEGFTRGFPATRGFRALCLLEQDDLDGAADALAVGAAQEPLLAEGTRLSYLYATARVRSARGELRQGLDVLRECEELIRQAGAPNPAAGLSWRSEAAWLTARLGEHEHARELIAKELMLARAFGAPRALGVALRTAGMIAGARAGLDQMAQAVETIEGSGFQLELARSLAVHGAALRRAGRGIEARAQLERGLDLAHRLGARSIAKHSRAELVAAGAKPRREAIFGREALTAAELRVARLAAQGLTTRELAQALFITTATAKTHLNRIYRKLAITRRAQLPMPSRGPSARTGIWRARPDTHRPVRPVAAKDQPGAADAAHARAAHTPLHARATDIAPTHRPRHLWNFRSRCRRSMDCVDHRLVRCRRRPARRSGHP
jgi:DNA-binding CsgD family transcriptional regulator